MDWVSTNAHEGSRKRTNDRTRALSLGGPVRQRGDVVTNRHPQLRRQLMARRAELGWSQSDLAAAAGVVRNTVGKLEKGLALREGAEAMIERALGWELGSIDTIRTGGEPTPIKEDGPPLDLRDDVERQIWAITDLDEDMRWSYIYQRRAKFGLDQSRPDGQVG